MAKAGPLVASMSKVVFNVPSAFGTTRPTTRCVMAVKSISLGGNSACW
jgi:hypothetical protein